jgi:hypothetical protein
VVDGPTSDSVMEFIVWPSAEDFTIIALTNLSVWAFELYITRFLPFELFKWLTPKTTNNKLNITIAAKISNLLFEVEIVFLETELLAMNFLLLDLQFIYK